MVSRPALLLVVAAVVLVIAVAALLPTVHAQVVTEKFTTTIKVLTSKETFSATGSLDIAFIAYPKAVVHVFLTNPGSSDASATVSIDCLNKPSTTVTVPAGGEAEAVLELTVPSPPTSYIVCTVSADVPNITGIQLELYIEREVELILNESALTGVYKVQLFTEPYYVLGDTTQYFTYFLVHLAYGSPPSGYTTTLLVNSTITTSYSDTAVSENSRAVDAFGVVLNITDTLPATGRDLGYVNISFTVPRAGLVVVPYSWPVRIEMLPNVTKLVSLEGEILSVYLANMTGVFSGTTLYRYNMTLARVLRLEGVTEEIKSAILDGVPAVQVGFLELIAAKTVSVLVLVKSMLTDYTWIEPMYMNFTAEPRKALLNLTIPVIPGLDVEAEDAIVLNKSVDSIEFSFRSTALRGDGLYQVDTAGRGVNLLVYLNNTLLYVAPVEVYYIVLADAAGNTRVYTNVTQATSVELLNITSVSVSDDVLIVNATLLLHNFTGTHVLVLVPGNALVDIVEEIPLRLRVNVTLFGVADKIYVFTAFDRKPWTYAVRPVILPSDILVANLSEAVFRLELPAVTYNMSAWYLNMSGALRVCVTWLGGEPAAGVYVGLYTPAGEPVVELMTDERGCVVFDPAAGTYVVKAVAYIADRVYETTPKTVVLTDDTEVTLKFSSPKPIPPIENVVLKAPETVKPGAKIYFVVTLTLKFSAYEKMTFSGFVKCTGPEVIGPLPFTIVVQPGSKTGSTLVTADAPAREGDYVCYARVGDYVSEPVILKVTKITREEAMLLTQQSIMWILIALVIVLALVVVAIARKRGPVIAEIRG